MHFLNDLYKIIVYSAAFARKFVFLSTVSSLIVC